VHKVSREIQYDDFEEDNRKRILSFVENSDMFFVLSVFSALYKQFVELFVGGFYLQSRHFKTKLLLKDVIYSRSSLYRAASTFQFFFKFDGFSLI